MRSDLSLGGLLSVSFARLNNATAVPYQTVRTRPESRMRSSLVSSGG